MKGFGRCASLRSRPVVDSKVPESLAAPEMLSAIHFEQEHPNECLIGVPRDFGRKKFRLQSVGTDAQWDADDSVHKLSASTPHDSKTELYRWAGVSRLGDVSRRLIRGQPASWTGGVVSSIVTRPNG